MNIAYIELITLDLIIVKFAFFAFWRNSSHHLEVNEFIAIAGADQDKPRPPLFNKEAIKKTVKSL